MLRLSFLLKFVILINHCLGQGDPFGQFTGSGQSSMQVSSNLGNNGMSLAIGMNLQGGPSSTDQGSPNPLFGYGQGGYPSPYMGGQTNNQLPYGSGQANSQIPYGNGQVNYQTPYGNNGQTNNQMYGNAQSSFGNMQSPYGSAQSPYGNAQSPYGNMQYNNGVPNGQSVQTGNYYGNTG